MSCSICRPVYQRTRCFFSNGSFRDECLNVNWLLSLDEACNKIETWRQEYNSYRQHISLKGKTPIETENL